MENSMKKMISIISVLLLVGAQAHGMDHQQLNEKFLEIARYNVHPLNGLIEAKADVNCADQWGTTALMHAARGNRLSSLNALIEANADVNRTDRDGNTALMKAAESHNTECLKALIQANANIHYSTQTGETALTQAAQDRNLPICTILVDAMLWIPNPEQKKKIIILLGLNKYRNTLGFLGFGPNFAPTFIPHLRAAIYEQNKQNFVQSVAFAEIYKIKNDSIRRKLLENYSIKPDGTSPLKKSRTHE